MKRIKLKITRNLKSIIAIASILGLSALYTTTKPVERVKCMLNYSFIGIGAALKSRKVDGEKTAYDALDEGTKKFVDMTDEVLKDSFKGLLTEKALEEKLNAYKAEHGTGLSEEKKKELEDIVESVKKQAQELQKLKDAGINGKGGESPFAKAWKENGEGLKAFLKKETKSFTMEIKAQQMPTDIATHTIGDRVPGIGQDPVRKPFMEDIFPSVTCNLEFIKYIDQEVVVRDAKMHNVAVATAHDTKVTWKERNIQVTGVRDYIDVPIDMMEDYDFVEGEVRNLLNTSVQLKVDDQLLNGDGAAPNLHSVNEYASEFNAANTLGGTIAPWTNSIKDANIFDLIIAMASQIIALGKSGSYFPDTVLMNSVDRYKGMLIKDANGQYLLPPFVAKIGDNEYKVDSMRVRSNPNVTANTIYVFDSSKGTIYNRKGLILDMSYENNDNFETEVVTIKARRRLNLLVRKVNWNAFMKCSDVQVAIEAITAA